MTRLSKLIVELEWALLAPLLALLPILVAPPLFHGYGFATASLGLMLGMPVVLQRRFDWPIGPRHRPRIAPDRRGRHRCRRPCRSSR